MELIQANIGICFHNISHVRPPALYYFGRAKVLRTTFTTVFLYSKKNVRFPVPKINSRTHLLL
jgi:hypothetical protein